MANIIAAHFDSVDQANRALAALQANGFMRSQMSSFHVSAPGQHDLPPLGNDESDADPDTTQAGGGALSGAALGGTTLGIVGGIAAAVLMPGAVVLLALGSAAAGAYAGSLVGALNGLSDTDDESNAADPARTAGLMIAVRIDRTDASNAAQRILREEGGVDIEEAEGTLHNGQWVDFDPREPPQRPASSSTFINEEPNMSRKQPESKQPESKQPEKEFGEGNYKASRQFNEASKKFVDAGRVDEAARNAAPANEAEARELERAEIAGKSRAKEEDPALLRRGGVPAPK